MKAVVIGEPSGATMETIMNAYPRHKAVVDKYISARMMILLVIAIFLYIKK